MKAVVFSLGCKVNQYESDAFCAKLSDIGYEVSEKLEFADVYVLNTCAVTAEAERKSRQAVTRVLNINPEAKILVTGCASENYAEPFSKRGEVVFVGGTENKLKICDMLKNYFENGSFEVETDNGCACGFEEMGFSKSLRTRHYVKVQDGCNNFCSYCLIPYLRGRSRSRALKDVLSEIEYASKVTKEIVLTGINLSAYGADIGSSLAELVESLKDFDVRIRLGSLEANVVTKEFLDATKKLKNFCDHFHLSLQSGDDEVLKKMNRKYTAAEFKSAVALLREYYPEAAVTTDVIVGFPTETDEAFSNTVKFAREIEFADMHIFSYSPRKRTVAEKMKKLGGAVVDERHKELEKVKIELRDAYNAKFLNRPLEVLFESKQNGFFSGHTKNYITVYREQATRGEIDTVVCNQLFKDGLK